MHGHSPAAALVDACECERCEESRRAARRVQLTPRGDLSDWWLFTIRSRDVEALKSHRIEMQDDGWNVGPIEIADDWSANTVKFVFSARIPKAAVTEDDMKRLVEWDRSQGE